MPPGCFCAGDKRALGDLCRKSMQTFPLLEHERPEGRAHRRQRGCSVLWVTPAGLPQSGSPGPTALLSRPGSRGAPSTAPSPGHCPTALRGSGAVSWCHTKAPHGPGQAQLTPHGRTGVLRPPGVCR